MNREKLVIRPIVGKSVRAIEILERGYPVGTGFLKASTTSRTKRTRLVTNKPIRKVSLKRYVSVMMSYLSAP